MKQLLQPLFFFLLVTQINFAQAYVQNPNHQNKPLKQLPNIEQEKTRNVSFDNPTPAWVRHYINPTELSHSEFQSVVVGKDGNIYVGGFSEESFPRNKVSVLAKYDITGKRQWIFQEKTDNNWWNGFQTLAIDSSDNLYVQDYQKIIKYNTEGVKQWSIDSVGVWVMEVDNLGNFYCADVVCKEVECKVAEVVIKKYNTNGVFQWNTQFTLGLGAWNAVGDICVDTSGNVIITGYGNLSGQTTPTAFVVKYTNDGTEIWKATYSGLYGSRIALGDSGTIYLSGGTDDQRHFTIKYQANGTRKWVRETAGYSREIVTDMNGNVIATMNVNSNSWKIVKYDKHGTLKWASSFSRPNPDYSPNSLAVDKYGNSFVTGSSDKEMAILSLDENGSTRYSLTYPNCGGGSLALSAGVVSSENVYIVGGSDGEYGNFHKALLVSLSPSGIQEWIETYEGPKIPMDAAADLGLDSIGNVYVCATGAWRGGVAKGLFVMKYDAYGTLLWKKVVDSISSNSEYRGPEMEVSTDGSIFILHSCNDISQSYSLTALTSSGERRWPDVNIAKIGPTSWKQRNALLIDNEENIFAVTSTNDSTDEYGYHSKMVVAKYLSSGTPLWSDRVSERTPVSAMLDSDGELSILTIASSWYGTGIDSPAVYRFDNSGNIRWIFKLDTVDIINNFGFTASNDGSVYIAGTVYLQSPGRSYFRTIKLNEMGVLEWVKDYDEGNDFNGEPVGIGVDKDGNVVIIGFFGFSYCCPTDIAVIVSYDASGNLRWVSKTPFEWGISKMTIDKNGDIFIGYGRFRFEKYSNGGKLLWSASYANPDWPALWESSFTKAVTEDEVKGSSNVLVPHYGFIGSEVSLIPDGYDRLYVTGSFGDYFSGLDGPGSSLSSIITTLRYDLPAASMDEIVKPTPQTFKLLQNYPNPFNPSTRIQYQVSSNSHVTLKVYDVLGNEVASLVNEEKEAGSYEVEFDAEKLTSGVYFYQLLVSALQSKDGKAGSFIETKKMLLLR